MKKTKMIVICTEILVSISLIFLTACGDDEKSVASNFTSSIVTSETSASLGIYTYDTDNDGNSDKVVDRYGVDLSQVYTLKENGIYEGENLVLPLEQTEEFVPVTELIFTVTEKTVHPENSFTLDLIIMPENATTKELEFTTDNAEILKIENGNITALTNGEATVTATAKAGGAKATCKIIVNDKAEKREIQNEEAITSGGTIYNSNTNNIYKDTQINNNVQSNTDHTNTGGSTNVGNTNAGNTNPVPPQPETPHIHIWIDVSPENSGIMDYGAECRIHGYNGEAPMFFRTQNDLFLHQAADGCTSSWGVGFKGLAYKYCSECGERVITGHVHDFGTIAKQVYLEKVICECGMSFSDGKDYTALESWKTHVEIYTNHGHSIEEHDNYQIVTSSITRYEATKTCSCGWRPIDNDSV